MSKHRAHQEGDEIVCSCGLRWEVGEDDPHPSDDEYGHRVLQQLKQEFE